MRESVEPPTARHWCDSTRIRQLSLSLSHAVELNQEDLCRLSFTRRNVDDVLIIRHCWRGAKKQSIGHVQMLWMVRHFPQYAGLITIERKTDTPMGIYSHHISCYDRWSYQQTRLTPSFYTAANESQKLAIKDGNVLNRKSNKRTVDHEASSVDSFLRLLGGHCRCVKWKRNFDWFHSINIFSSAGLPAEPEPYILGGTVVTDSTQHP